MHNMTVCWLEGRLKVGDQLLKVNGRSLEGLTYSDSLSVLRESAATGQRAAVSSGNGSKIPFHM